MKAMIKKSNLNTAQLTSINKVYNAKNVFYLSIINNTAFEIEINDRVSGKMIVIPGQPVTIVGFPQYPFDVALTAKFNNAAPATDFITIITNSIG